MAKIQFDVYQEVTDAILAEIEKGTPPWRQPWSGGAVAALPQKWNGEDYSGINVILLWATAATRGFASSRWMTFRQAKELGGMIRKGSKSSTSIKYGTFERENAETGLHEQVPFARAYRVFNADQIEGLPEEYYIQPEPGRTFDTETDARLDSWLMSRGADIRSSDEPSAYYHMKLDQIHLPRVEHFYSPSGYYATALHELMHWTGHHTRLARLDEAGEVKGRRDYAFEELVAEIGACMASVTLGIAPDFSQSAAYVESWAKVLKQDKRAIFRAAAQAQAAADFVRPEEAENAVEEAEAA
ncbi:zincin-like metallopeptidase domain-containing protein [Roseibaca sp. V10]|uniref:Zincin-like metallopeptidase domain-containing protein n=1 Tax=Roseinatronobacter domitianus TaxID=2940293 RepID=A0ABT0M5I3_9RHOB|nr:zincin-like metallopeptidase domain-containing protein [Roseibaca domitiana]MCL1630120.1 zincin-like metallopeptidase domain-containing protein [Roseibaca domitiana]